MFLVLLTPPDNDIKATQIVQIGFSVNYSEQFDDHLSGDRKIEQKQFQSNKIVFLG